MDFFEIAFLVSFTLLEIFLPGRKLKFFREGFFEDVTYFLIVVYLIPYIYNLLPWTIDSYLTFHFLDLSNYNIFFQAALCFVLTDLCRYLLHYSFHRFPIMWGIHKLHHSGKELTAMSGYRQGYWEDICLIVFTILPMSFLKFDVEVIKWVVLFFSMFGYYLHCNVKIRYPWYLRFLASPQFHQWHHSIEEKTPYGQNNGVALTIWDKILGTYYDSEEYPEELGLYRGEKMEGNFFSRYFYPLTGRNKKK